MHVKKRKAEREKEVASDKNKIYKKIVKNIADNIAHANQVGTSAKRKRKDGIVISDRVEPEINEKNRRETACENAKVQEKILKLSAFSISAPKLIFTHYVIRKISREILI